MTRFTNVRKQAEANNYPLTCRLCSKKHPLRVCPIFRAKRPEERLRDVLIHRYCTNCLSGIHRAAHCTNPGRCRRCNEEHHTMLHIDHTTRPMNDSDSDDALSLDASEVGAETNAFRPDLEEEEMPVAGAETNAFRPDESTGMESNALHPDSVSGLETRTFQPRNNWYRTQTRRFNHRPRRQRHNGRVESHAFHLPARNGFRSGQVQAPMNPLQQLTAVAPTAIVRVEAGGRLHLVRALINPCAATSIIALDLAQELKLCLTAVGNQRGCFMKLRGKHGNSATITLHAVAVRNYRQQTPLKSLDATVAAPYNNIKLADPHFHIAAPVRLVLGAEVFPKMLLGAIPAGTLGPLLAQNTIFGWVLSGAC
ncbi:uncharacterized protein LOC118756214 [Rhagoletis pomonella]|uniref:uncharacterized protein LOC118756214 n=1 Tax=Rhagoletis pomonella TaxID=28610 RepID=UPI00177FA01E|nr:uncharacterized protein LOC118756214 [Rhagoletis pomonella]